MAIHDFFRWLRSEEPALATGVIGSTLLAVAEELAAGPLAATISAVGGLAMAYVTRFLVFKPGSVVSYRSTDKLSVHQGPGA